uniref:Uncharacterized protein n=1 Tax=Rhizophora mucronata TaxID=61149 RepID=A0A2P2PBU8_RHIMU
MHIMQEALSLTILIK